MALFFMLIVGFYVWHGLGITIGFHRLLAHRSFRCPKFVEYFFVLPAYLAFQGSPVWWATMHRAHHKYSDTPLDPHSPRGGLWNAYMFYRTGMCSSYKYPDHIDPIKQSPDLMKDPVYRFLEQYGTNSWAAHYLLNIGICIGFRVLLLWCFGWAVALASCIAAVLAFNAPLVFNILSHIPRLGYRNFATEDDSNNCWWLAILSMGDGWHNNHHAIPGSARTGLRPHEIDMSWLILKTCRSLKLVSHLNEPRKHPNGTAYTSNFSKTREIYPLELALDQQRS